MPTKLPPYSVSTALVVLLALAVRTIFLFGSDVHTHIAGDISHYVHYAWNLGQHGVYSSAAPGPITSPAPDGFRPPGYPLFLLFCMWLADFGNAWLAWAHALQIVVSAATVLLVMRLGRTWMNPGPSLLTGTLLAVWPHHVVFASTLLSETLLAFCLVLALWLTAQAHRKRSTAWTIAAGLAFGCAALVNTLVILFPLLVFGLFVTARSHRKSALAFLLSFLVLPTAWWAITPPAAPDAPTGLDRAAMNLVQGSWPQYHRAWRTRRDNEISRQIMGSIGEEVALILQDRRAGLIAIGDRLAQDPVTTARWYLLEKPWLLWDWDIRLGWHGIHFLPTSSSPFENNPALRPVHTALRLANPAIFALAAFATLTLLGSYVRGQPQPFAALATALFVVYVTALHVILQAEPRYAIAYRPEQILLACTGLSQMANLLQRRRRKQRKSDASGQFRIKASES